MKIELDKRVAVVTGAGAGLGRSHALLLAERGAAVVVNDLSDAADEVVAQIRAKGGRAVVSHHNVAEPESAAAIVDAALQSFGRIDILVNNAGILRDKTFVKMTIKEIEQVLRVHLFGTMFVTHAAWPHLLSQGYGRVVLTSSSSGLANSFGQANYAAAKAGMLGLMNSLKNEGRKVGVLVNVIAPVAATQMTDGLLGERLSSISQPEHVSAAVGWLCSEACNVTGEVIAAGAGHFAAVRMMKASGVVLDPDKPATIEEFAAVRSEVFNMEGCAPYLGTLDAEVRRKLGL